MASSEYIYKLATDPDYLTRLTVTAALAGEPYPEVWAREHALECVIANQRPLAKYQAALQDPYKNNPALNPQIVSDSHLMDMVSTVQAKLQKKDNNMLGANA